MSTRRLTASNRRLAIRWLTPANDHAFPGLIVGSLPVGPYRPDQYNGGLLHPTTTPVWTSQWSPAPACSLTPTVGTNLQSP